MTAASAVLNKGTLKLLAALAIPSTIAYFFYYSQQQANRELAEYQSQQKQHATGEDLVVNDYQMKEVDDANHLRWQLTSKSGKLMPNGQDVELKGIKIEYFDGATKALKMRLTAPTGLANQTTKFVRLQADDSARVIAEGEGGKSHFEAKQVELTKKNQFVATGGVIIVWPGVAKVSGNSASGSMNMAAGPKDFKVVGNTHAEIAVR